METDETKQERAASEWIAPRWHLATVLLVVLGFAAMAALGAHSPGMTPPIRSEVLITGYLFAAVVEWLMAALVWLGVRRSGGLRGLIGGRWGSAGAVLRDIGIASLFLVGSNVVSALLVSLLRVDPGSAVRSMLPHSGTEAALFFLMALTAGICEETIFRGYLQRQFTAMMGNAGAAVALQGILFAVFHGNQGWRFMAIIAVDGWLLGALAYWRRSLRPGMIAHCLQDGMVGLLAPYIFK